MIVLRKKSSKILIAAFAATLLVVALLIFIINMMRADAALSGWRAGNIISDATFTNKNTMSPGDIQNFLNSKVPVCNTEGEAWGRQRYNQSRFICLKDYQEGGRSSAQIIYDVAQKYSINPQVLLVLLQKEQALVTDTWPANVQYRSATGYGCPDTAPCDSQYYGLTNQLDWAAKMFRAIMNDSPHWYTPYNLGRNFIRYNPNADCGGSYVVIENRATKALYNYTPYQPNQGALNAGWGTAPCGAYGNRNFYLYFNAWFGSGGIDPGQSLYIPDGVYTIKNRSSGRAMDVEMARSNDGARVQIYNANNTSAQMWEITRQTDGFYTIKNVNSGKMLDVNGGSSRPGAHLQIWKNNSTCAQRWSINAVGENVALINKCSKLAVDITGGNTNNGTKLQIWSYNGSGSQQWNLTAHAVAPVPSGVYTIDTPTTGLSLDITGGNLANGTKLQIWEKNNSSVQRWQIARQADGLYTIYNPVSRKYLDVADNNQANGSITAIYTSKSACSQKWVISPHDTNFILRSACSGKALDIKNAQINKPGTPVQIWDSNQSLAQQWKLSELNNYRAVDGTYSILSTSQKSLDITGGNLANGTKLQIWEKNNSSVQRWQIARQADGLYTIYNPVSRKYLDVAGTVIGNNSQTQIWQDKKACSQKWTIIKSPSTGLHNIQSSCLNKLSLDVAGGQINTNGTRIQLYGRNDSGAQSWIFAP